MASELQRIAQELLVVIDRIPAIVAHLHELARQMRQQAAAIGTMQSDNMSARHAALQLDAAARACEEAAYYAEQVPLRATTWVQEMVSGHRVITPQPGQPDRPPGERDPRGRAPDHGNSRSGRSKPMSDDEVRRLFNRLPERISEPGHQPKTRGAWLDEHGQEYDLVSGHDDYKERADALATERGFVRPSSATLAITSHVEIKFAMMMRQRGIRDATIVINQRPCPGRTGCDNALPHFLPDDANLTIYAPDGYKKTYRGRSTEK